MQRYHYPGRRCGGFQVRQPGLLDRVAAFGTISPSPLPGQHPSGFDPARVPATPYGLPRSEAVCTPSVLRRERQFNPPVLLTETFVDPSRFAGTCYKSIGWTCLGKTRGFGRNGRHYFAPGHRKTIWVPTPSSPRPGRPPGPVCRPSSEGDPNDRLPPFEQVFRIDWVT